MIKKIILLVLLCSCLISFSQIDYEKGYFVNNNGKRTECFIKNYDWKNNPVSIEYKLNLESNALEAGLQDIAEFGIDNFSKYVRAYVEVDRTSRDLNNYGWSRIPEYKTETLFLKVLKEANITLYSYEDGNLNLYFLKPTDGKIEQLIYKPYKIDNQRIDFYQYFRQQLLNVMECKNSKSDIEKTHYNKVELESIFQKYYDCSSQKGTEINTNKPKSKYNITIRPGVTMRSFAFERNNFSAADVDFGNKTFGRLGIEFEVVLPFNKGKWALFLEPNYDYYNYSKTIPIYGDVKVDSKAINLPIGLRHYMFINKKSRFFLNLAYSLNVTNNSSASYQNAQNDIEIVQGSNLVGGLGFKYNKYSVEIRTDFSPSTTTNYSDIESKTTGFSFILGYTIF